MRSERDLGSGAAGGARKSQRNQDTCHVVGRKKEESQETERQRSGERAPLCRGRGRKKTPWKMAQITEVEEAEILGNSRKGKERGRRNC